MRKQSFSALCFGLSILWGYFACVAFPMLWVGYSSLKTNAAILDSPFSLPQWDNLQWRNFGAAWFEHGLGEYFLNSVLVSLCSVILILGIGVLAAYAFSRYWFRGKNGLFLLFLAGLMVPAQMLVLPLFFVFKELELLGSPWALVIVYTAIGLPFAVFVLTPFFRSLPTALYEAAKVDGGSEWTVFRRIMLPLAKPGVATVAIFQFIAVWKEFFFAFVLLSGGGQSQTTTLPVGLANLTVSSQYQTDWGVAFAGIVLVILPLLAVYLYFQRQLIDGISAGAVKG